MQTQPDPILPLDDPPLPISSSVADVARRHQLSVRTVWRLIHDGELKAVRLGGSTRVLADDERAWIERGRA